MKKIVVIDGQGGKIGAMTIDRLKKNAASGEIYGIGTNSIATSAMIKAGADYGATGENPVVVNAGDADIIIGPIGIISANSLLGEITPAMAAAIGASKAKKILLPVNKCNIKIAGASEKPIADLIAEAAKAAVED